MKHLPATPVRKKLTRKPRKQCLGIMVASVTGQATNVPLNEITSLDRKGS